MKNNYMLSCEALDRYFEGENDYNYCGKLTGKRTGYLVQMLNTELEDIIGARNAFISCVVDEDSETFYIEVYPQISVQPAYTAMTADYICRVNKDLKFGEFRIGIGGALYFFVAQSFREEPIGADFVEYMISFGATVMYNYVRGLETVSHGGLADPDKDDHELISAVLAYRAARRYAAEEANPARARRRRENDEGILRMIEELDAVVEEKLRDKGVGAEAYEHSSEELKNLKTKDFTDEPEDVQFEPTDEWPPRGVGEEAALPKDIDEAELERIKAELYRSFEELFGNRFDDDANNDGADDDDEIFEIEVPVRNVGSLERSVDYDKILDDILAEDAEPEFDLDDPDLDLPFN